MQNGTTQQWIEEEIEVNYMMPSQLGYYYFSCADNKEKFYPIVNTIVEQID